MPNLVKENPLTYEVYGQEIAAVSIDCSKHGKKIWYITFIEPADGKEKKIKVQYSNECINCKI